MNITEFYRSTQNSEEFDDDLSDICSINVKI